MIEIVVPVDALEEMPGNENVMVPEKFGQLVTFMREVGYKQPILIWEPPNSKGRYQIVDGAHRKDAAVALGMKEVLCELDGSISCEAEAKAVRIGMNRNRGELDLSAVGRTMLDLSLTGWSPADLTVVGYSEEEVQALLEAAAGGPDPDELTTTVSMTTAERKDEEKPKVYKMVVEFEREEDWRRCHKVLSEVGGGDLAAGLVKILLEEA